MIALLNLIASAITIYVWIIVIGVVLSWLVAFNVVNTHNRFVYTVVDTINRLTEPALRRSATSCPISAASTFRRSS